MYVGVAYVLIFSTFNASQKYIYVFRKIFKNHLSLSKQQQPTRLYKKDAAASYQVRNILLLLF